jgi:hypothetical protein
MTDGGPQVEKPTRLGGLDFKPLLQWINHLVWTGDPCCVCASVVGGLYTRIPYVRQELF